MLTIHQETPVLSLALYANTLYSVKQPRGTTATLAVQRTDQHRIEEEYVTAGEKTYRRGAATIPEKTIILPCTLSYGVLTIPLKAFFLYFTGNYIFLPATLVTKKKKKIPRRRGCWTRGRRRRCCPFSTSTTRPPFRPERCLRPGRCFLPEERLGCVARCSGVARGTPAPLFWVGPPPAMRPCTFSSSHCYIPRGLREKS